MTQIEYNLNITNLTV